MIRTAPVSSRRMASPMVATGSPRLPPRPRRTSGTPAPIDDHRHVIEHRVDGGGGLAHLHDHPLDRRAPRAALLRVPFVKRRRAGARRLVSPWAAVPRSAPPDG